MSMSSWLYSFLFRGLSRRDATKFSILSAAFFFIIGSYWTIRALKNAIIKDTVGVSGIPFAKKVSVVIIICLLLLYSKLVDNVAKSRLFYVVCGAYAVCFFVLAYLIAHPGLVNQHWLGYVSYSLIESFGSLVVALFWAFVAMSVNVSSAKRGYAFVFGMGQVGAMIGTSLVTKTALFGIPLLMCISACGILVIPFLISKFISFTKKDEQVRLQDTTPVEKGSRAGLFEGIRLLATKPYVFGIFLIATLYEIVVTIFDYQMQVLADKKYGLASYAAFNAHYGQLVTLFACIFAFFGTRLFIKKLGFRVCLLIFPAIVAVLVGCFYFSPSLWVALGSMVTIKALSYGFNNPVKEIIYIPTSEAIKFKAKSWIEMFGNRSSKAGGATINGVLGGLPQGFMTYGVIISFLVIGGWFIVALMMGNAFTRLIKRKRIVQ